MQNSNEKNNFVENNVTRRIEIINTDLKKEDIDNLTWQCRRPMHLLLKKKIKYQSLIFL